MKVSILKTIKFNSLSLYEKVRIKNTGRPTPDLDIVQIHSGCKARPGGYKRKFGRNLYDRTWWLCGCEETNRLFCFVCLLYSIGDDSWTRQGVRDLKHLRDNVKKHENSATHKQNVVSFQLLGTSNNGAHSDSIRLHNETVTKNHEVLSAIIDIIKLCGSDNSAAFGQYEAMSSLKNSEVPEMPVQDELLDCMLDVCRDFIIQEVRQSSFLTCMIEDITDLSDNVSTTIVFRYELNGNVRERFWAFANAENYNAPGLSKLVLENLQSLLEDSPEKLVALTYNGAAVFQDPQGDVHMKIKEVYNNAHYMHCYAHQFSELLEQVSSHISSVRIFFSTIRSISEFFLKAAERSAALEQICRARMPKSSNINWENGSGIVQSIYRNIAALLDYFENILNGMPRKFNMQTTCQAAGFMKWLNDVTFQYWLSFFNELIPQVDFLYMRLQKAETDFLQIQEEINCFEAFVLHIRETVPCPELKQSEEELQAKKLHETFSNDLQIAAKEICDRIVSLIKDKFKIQNHLSGAKLFLSEKYKIYKSILPISDIETFCEAYPMVDKELLGTELRVFYQQPEILENGVVGCLKTLNFLISFGLDSDAFKEISKVLKILVTLPMVTSETGQRFSSLKVIKTFVRNRLDGQRLSAHGMLSIESEMVSDISGFNKLTIEKFCERTHKMEFCYK